MKAALVYNPKSGSGSGTNDLDQSFANAGITIVKKIKIGPDLKKDLRPYLDQDKIAIAVHGGDGTQSAVAGLAVNKPVVMVPLSGGTLNHFTKDLGVSQNLDTALGLLHAATPRKIDVASVNDKIIINNSSIGLYPNALKMRDEMTSKNLAKWPAAIIASIKAFLRYRSYAVTMGDLSIRTPFIFVGNNDYKLEQRIIGERTRMDQGVLSVYAINSRGRLHLFWILLKALFGQIASTDEILVYKPKKLVVRTKRSKVRVSRDGEHEIIDSPLEYKVIPAGLRVLTGTVEE